MSYYRQGPSRPGGGQIRLGIPTLTPMIKAIMIACGGMWLLQLVAIMAKVPLEPWLGLLPFKAIRGFLWQPLTYMFLHAPGDPFHLLFNMLYLWMFGGDLERAWGGRAFLRYYLVCGGGAGVIITIVAVLGGDAGTLTIGASGAIFGVLTAFGMVFAGRTVLFMMIFPMKARTMVIIMAGLQMFYLLNQSGGGVSYVAHLSGALVGFLYLQRIWRFGEFYRNLRWKFLRRKFKVMPPPDDDRWIH